MGLSRASLSPRDHVPAHIHAQMALSDDEGDSVDGLREHVAFSAVSGTGKRVGGNGPRFLLPLGLGDALWAARGSALKPSTVCSVVPW